MNVDSSEKRCLMKRFVEWGLNQSVFANLVICYLLVQVIVIILLDSLFRVNFSPLDKFIMSHKLSSVSEVLGGYSSYDFNLSLVRDGIEILVIMPEIAIPVDPDTAEMVHSLKPDAEYFLVSCKIGHCKDFAALFYVLPDGSLNIDVGSQLLKIPLIHYKVLLSKETESNFREFLEILKQNITWIYSLRTFLLFLKESTIILGSQLMGSAVLIIILTHSLLESLVVFAVSRLFSSESFGNIFTLTNFINSVLFTGFFSISAMFGVWFNQVGLFKVAVFAVFLSSLLIWFKERLSLLNDRNHVL